MKQVPPEFVAILDAQIATLRNQVDHAMPSLKHALSETSPEYVVGIYAGQVRDLIATAVDNGLCICDIAKMQAYLLTRIARLEMENERLKRADDH